MKILGAEYQGILMPNQIQPKEHSIGSGMGDILRIYVWRDLDGNRWVPYLNRNDAKRNLNLNYLDNGWNENYRFLARRNSFRFSHLLMGFILSL